MKARALVLGVVGAAAMYLFDPALGRTRRSKLTQQLGGLGRRARSGLGRRSEYMRGRVEGLRHMGSSHEPPANDETLTARIASELLSRRNYPKGAINVNTVAGVVELRGTCDSQEQIDDLEAEVRKMTGVIDVRNYLHLPGTPAPG
jgi:hypothetical protein